MGPTIVQSVIMFPAKKNLVKTKKAISKPKDNNSIPAINCYITSYADDEVTPTKGIEFNNLLIEPSSASATLNKGNNMPADESRFLNSLPCRRNELKELQDFLFLCLNKKSSGSMYISGLPGTGKTAALLHLIEVNEIASKCQIVMTNCTSVKSSTSIYQQISTSLKIKCRGKTGKASIDAIEKHIKRGSEEDKMILLILDEVDQLTSKFQTVLYKIFEWPSMVNSRLILIGIANAVDLTDRILPRLRSLTLQPRLLHFKPYTKQEIVTILQHRLAQSDDANLFAPGSLELISAKVAGQSGDLRRALDLGRRVLEVSRTRSTTILSPQSKLFVDQRQLSSEESINFIPLISSSSKIQASEEAPKKMSKMSDNSNILSPRKRSYSDMNAQRVGDTIPKKCSRKLGIASGLNQEKENSSCRTSPRKKHGIDSSERSPRKELLKAIMINELGVSPRKSNDEAIENHSSTSPLSSPLKMAKLALSPRRSPRKHNSGGVPVNASPSHAGSIRAIDVLSVVNQMNSSARNLRTEQSAFPLHQKILICTLMLLLTKGKNRDINIGKLHEVYARVCGRRGLTSVDQSSFISLCRQVEMTGALQIGKGPARLAKVALQWDETEVTHALKDTSLLKAILSDTAVLNKK